MSRTLGNRHSIMTSSVEKIRTGSLPNRTTAKWLRRRTLETVCNRQHFRTIVDQHSWCWFCSRPRYISTAYISRPRRAPSERIRFSHCQPPHSVNQIARQPRPSCSR
jgi:hypothetical protein